MSSNEQRRSVPAETPSSTTAPARPATGSDRRARPPSPRKQASRTPAPTRPRFSGKTEEMRGHIFDLGVGQANRFHETHRELAEYVARTCKNGYGAALAIQNLQPPAHAEPTPPATQDADGNDISDAILQIEMYKWKKAMDEFHRRRDTTRRT